MSLERAVTLKEWEAQLTHTTSLKQRIQWAVNEVDADGWLGRHGLAALCLHGMPYGFTLLDVETLRAAAEVTEREVLDRVNVYPAALDPVIRLRNLADRIEALLPPVSEGSPPTP